MKIHTLSGLLLFTGAFAPAAQPAKTDALKEQIIAQERAELECLKTGDMKAFADLISEDAVFVDPHGTADKALVVKTSAEVRLSQYSMTDIKFVVVSPESGVVAYRLEETGTSHGKAFTAHVNASALWIKRGGKWVCLFSQETPTK